MTDAQQDILQDKVQVWQNLATTGPMDMRDYNRRAAVALSNALTELTRLQELHDFMAGLSESQFADLAASDEGETFLNRIVGVLGNALP